jgi:hypothetical protein
VDLLFTEVLKRTYKDYFSEDKILTELLKMERGRFELPIPVSRDGGFQDRCIQPLCHLSLGILSVEGANEDFKNYLPVQSSLW